MARPKKTRLIEGVPKITQFSPRGKAGRPNEIEIKAEQFEVIRLVDYLEMSQKQAATKMGLSRQTIGRILQRARKIISDGLVNGKIIRIISG